MGLVGGSRATMTEGNRSGDRMEGCGEEGKGVATRRAPLDCSDLAVDYLVGEIGVTSNELRGCYTRSGMILALYHVRYTRWGIMGLGCGIVSIILVS